MQTTTYHKLCEKVFVEPQHVLSLANLSRKNHEPQQIAEFGEPQQKESRTSANC
jgi:hypothetical protein